MKCFSFAEQHLSLSVDYRLQKAALNLVKPPIVQTICLGSSVLITALTFV